MSQQFAAYITNEFTTLDDVKENHSKLAFYQPNACIDGWTEVGVADITVTFIDEAAVVKQMVEGLRASQQKVKADAHVAWQQLEDKIQSLLSLEHKHEE